MGDSWIGLQNRRHFEDLLVEPNAKYRAFLCLYSERFLEIQEVESELATEKAFVDHEYRLIKFVAKWISENDIIRQADDRLTSGHPNSVHELV